MLSKPFCRFIFIVFLFWANPNPIFGQKAELLPPFTVRQFTGEDGLADNKISWFFQHPNGFCWAATNSELMRFDGYRFSTFARNLPPISGITINSRSEILLLHPGKYLNFTLINPENKAARHLEFSSERDLRDSIVATALQDSLVWAAAQSPTGIWFYRVGALGKPMQKDFLEGENFFGKSGIQQFLVEKDKPVFWLSHSKKGLLRRDFSKGETQFFNKFFDGKTWRNLPGTPQIFLENGRTPILTFQNSPILLLFDEKTNALQWLGQFPGGRSAAVAASDSRGNLVVKTSKTDLKNAWLFRAAEKTWVNLSPVLGKYSLINVAGKDFDRQITAVTLEGLVQVNFHRTMFQQLLPEGDLRSAGIFETRGIATDPKTGRTVVMSEKYGVFLENQKTHVLEPQILTVGNPKKQFVPAPNVSISFDENGFLWVPVARPDSNFAKIDLAKRQATVFEVPGKMAVKAFAHARLASGESRFWLAVANEFDNAIFVFDPKTEAFSMVASGGTHPDLEGNTPFFLLENKNGQFWLGGTKGLRLFDPVSNQFLRYPGDDGWEQNFTVAAISEGENDLLFVGTLGDGLRILNTKTGAWQVFWSVEGLAGNDKIAGILPDKNGNCWVATYDGLSFLYRKPNGTASFINFSTKEGLTHDEFNRFSYHISPDGKFYFGGLFGVNVFLPEEILSNFDLENAPVLLSQYARLGSDDGKPVEIDTGLGRLDSIVFPPSNRAFSFRFALANYWNPEKNRFRYRIEGLQNGEIWQPIADNSREITINYLPAGNYVLRVQGASAYGVWSDDERRIAIRVEEIWYKTDLAFFAYCLLIGLAILFFNRHQRSRRLEKLHFQQKERELENEHHHAQHLEKLNEAFGRFVPHEFLKRLGYASVLDTRLGDQIKTRMTILFADIRDWTTLSEKMEPAENFNFINAYLNRVGPVIRENNGFVNQYFGDGIMALFPEKAEDALRAAVQIQRAVSKLNFEHEKNGQFPAIRVGIGLHTGSLMLGVLGDQNRFDTGVISDAVNTAARVEGLTKIFAVNILASAATLGEVAENQQFANRFLGKIKVKGKQEPLGVFEIFDGENHEILLQKQAGAPWFERGLQHYFLRKFEDALRCFSESLRLNPDDAVAELYRRRCKKFMENEPDLEWSGVEMMERK